MENFIKICYVDDRLDLDLSEYLDEFSEKYNSTPENTFKIETYEVEFDISSDNYKTLLLNKDVNEANILIIDSNLFNDHEVGEQKLTGEKFKFILNYALPYIKTIVITQNDFPENELTLKKFRSQEKSKSAFEHYDGDLKEKLMELITRIIEDRKIYKQIMEDTGIDSQLTSSIDAAISGIVVEKSFEKEDIDRLIEIFEEVKSTYGK